MYESIISAPCTRCGHMDSIWIARLIVLRASCVISTRRNRLLRRARYGGDLCRILESWNDELENGANRFGQPVHLPYATHPGLFNAL